MKLKNIKSILAVALCAVGLAAFADGTGTNDDPWLVGYPTQMNVEVWTNGTGRLDIDGTGAMMGFSASSPAPWADASFTEAVVGSNVTAIGASAFRSCPNLKTLVLNEQTPPTLGAGNDFSKAKIFVPAGKADAYRASEGWKAYADAIEEMRSVKGKELTTHLYEMTYSWWDAVKANDIGEMLAAYMAQPDQLAENGMSVPHAIPAWFGELQGAVLCTSCRNGNFVGRNFDWGYDDVDECVMHIPAAEGRLASVGVVSWFFPKEMQKLFDVDSFLPELTMDGINEKGVAINVNVVPGGDNGWTTNTNPKATKRLNAGFAVRTVLDNATNAAHAVEILESRDIYSLKPLEFHWMISDKDESYVVECVSNALVVLKAKDARPKMSNYYVTHSPSVGEYDILTNAALTATFHTPRAMGIERYANVSNGLESVDSVNAMYTHMTNVWYKLKYLPGNEQKYWSDMNGAPIPDQSGTFTAFDGPELNEARSNAFKQIQANYVAVTNYEAHHEGSRTIDHDECPELTNGVVHTVHTSIYDIEKRKLRVVVQEDAARAFNVYLTPPPPVEALSNKFALDLTVGDRVAKDTETLVVDPAWDETDSTSAKVRIDGEDEPRTYTCASNDLWQTASLEPGRYEAELMTACSSCVAGFWKVGDDWVVFDSSNITADVTFEAGKTYLFFGTNTADGVTLKVEDGAKFEYDEGAPAGFLGGTVNLPTRYEQKTVEGEFYQIVEKIKGCEGNPWVVGEGVTAYTNGTELVIGGAGTVGALSGVDGLKDLLAGLTAINVTSNGVTGAEAQAFADVGTAGGSVMLTLPDGWQGELPDDDGNWYGAKNVTLRRVPLAVKKVKFAQRYPWNGLVNVGFTLTGPEGETNVVITVRDGEAAVTNFTAAVTIPADGVLATNLVWDAAAAGLAANFKSDDVTVEVKIDESDIAAKSAAGTVDLRTAVALAEGAVTVAGVSWSATLWGAVDETFTTVGWTNLTTGATGVFGNLSNIMGEGKKDVTLPKKNGDYMLTHSTGDLKSFVMFTVSGYQPGSETNPWEIGANAAADVIAFTNGSGTVFFKPARSAVSREGLDAVTNAMGGASFPAKLISEDGSETNDLVMVLGASGTVYDTIADALAANEASYTLFDVNGYLVSYNGGEGALGTMATDTFIPTVPTNLTANAYEIIGYRFDGWTNAVAGVFYTNRQEGVDFAQPGETLALTALWTQVELEPADYDGLTNMIARVTRPAKIKIVSDIEIPAGGKIVVPEGKSVTFTGDGKFDVSDIVPQFGEPVTVGEGLAEGDLDRFDADGVSKPVFEDGKVVLHARGESEDFPWVIDEENGVTAWVDPALTNLAAVVIDNGMPMATNAIDLVALTNNLATYGYEPAKTPLNALLAVGKDGGAPEYVKPVNWIGEGGKYATLEAALAAGKTAVVPNFVTEEIPEEIVETGTGDDGETYTAVVENKPAEDVEEPVKATYAEGLLNIATNVKQNVKLEVTPTNVEDVAQQTVTSLTNVLLTALKDQEGHPMRIMETNMVDLSVYYNEAKQTALNSLIAIHIPWTINAEYTYGVSRMHDGVAQAIPEAQPPVDLTSGTECFVVDPDRNEIVLYVKNFSDYLIAGTMPLVPRIGASIKWKSSTGSGTVWAQLTLQVTNGQASAVSKVRYVFQDRTDAKLWSAQKSLRTTPATELTKSEYPDLDQSVTWRYVEIPTSDAAYTGLVAGNRVTWGWTGSATDNKVAWSEGKIELYKKTGVISATEAGQYLGWVVWTAYGVNYCAPVGNGAAAVATVANLLRAPLSVASVNKAAAYGNAYLMDGSDPDCEIAAFTVGEGTIRGRIALKGAGGKENAPGGNVKATLYGANSLDGLFASCGTLALAADGTFETPIPNGKAFFKVKIEVVNVIK